MSFARALAIVTLSALPFAACVAPTNPYDPEAPAEIQAKGKLEGRAVIDNPTIDDATLLRELAALRVGLLDEDGARLEEGGGPLAITLKQVDTNGGKFAFDALTPGRYTVVFDNVPSYYRAPPIATVRVLPGGNVDVGALVFVAIDDGEGGPGEINGDVAVLEGDAGERTVELYRLTASGEGAPAVELLRSAVTEGAFAFRGLAPGTYAVVGSANGFTPDFRLDLLVGDGDGAQLVHSLAGASALTLRSVSAVLIPTPTDTVRVRDGIAYARGDDVTLAVFTVGGATGCASRRTSRSSTRPVPRSRSSISRPR